MSHYKSNLRDIEFTLFDVLGAERVLGSGPYEQMDGDTARGLLTEVDRLAREELAASFVEGDRNPPTFDPDMHSVTLPAAFTRSYQALMDGEWYRLDLPDHLGGMGVSPSLRWAASELIVGANPAVFMYAAGAGFAAILDRIGGARDKRIAELMVTRQWGGTMVLTEPDAGSDVGAGRTSARQQPDGSWHLEGVKRFITSGDWDWPENIVHLVLARPEGHRPGTKGLSLFVVPKFLFDLRTGELGERNGVDVTNLEHKMGLKVSATCELTFGQHRPAVGYLVGDVHDGIAQMFQVIENARMFVGAKAIATLSTGYLTALDFAKTRVQGADMTELTNKAAPRVTITHHPDVRRMLMLQKAYAEGMRALLLYAASFQDRVEVAAAAGEPDPLAEGVNDLLLPIVKGFGSERSSELLALSLQVLGGSGYLQDYPIEQYIRDAKIDTLYEGTTSIQGMDLFFRKIVRDQGRALTALLNAVADFAKGDAGNGALARERELLGRALEDTQAMVGAMVGFLPNAAEHSRQIYLVGLNTTRLLMSIGDLLTGWLLLRKAEVALDRLGQTGGDAGRRGAEGRPVYDRAFYQGKVAAARFFAGTVLPELRTRRELVESTDLDLMDLDEAAF